MRLGLVVSLTVALAGAPLVACQSDADVADGSTPPATGGTTNVVGAPPTSSGTVPTPAGGSLYQPGDIDTGLAPWIEDATADLAARLSIEPAAVSTIAAVLVTWPDTALGCPEPDRQYATVATDGALIELVVDGAVYRYHAGGARGPFLCPRPLAERPAPGA